MGLRSSFLILAIFFSTTLSEAGSPFVFQKCGHYVIRGKLKCESTKSGCTLILLPGTKSRRALEIKPIPYDWENYSGRWVQVKLEITEVSGDQILQFFPDEHSIEGLTFSERFENQVQLMQEKDCKKKESP
ncbi:MAG: hypothetical protein KA715_05225 [Xanthomonadaceae bacterium]|nr:hypothetical protein [Xanthomonadaceae bacterium]